MNNILFFQAETPKILKQRLDNFIYYTDANPQKNSCQRPEDFPESREDILRLSIWSESSNLLIEKLKKISGELYHGTEIEHLDDPENGVFAGRTWKSPQMVMLFPGQGAQYLNMGKYYYDHSPDVRELYEKLDHTLEDILPNGLRSYIYSEADLENDTIQKSLQIRLRDTNIAQPAIVSLSVAISMVLDFFEIKPNIAIGHSLGEISALHVAGAFDLETSVKIAALRGKFIDSVPVQDRGAMGAIRANAEEVQKLIEPYGQSISISNYNSPTQTVVSGTTQAVRELLHFCHKQKYLCAELPVSHAFHSHIIAPAVEPFREALEWLSFNKLSRTVISTSTGKKIKGPMDLKELLVEHIRRPVRFIEAVHEANRYQPVLWVEVGPGNTLSGLVNTILNPVNSYHLVTDLRGEDSSVLLKNVISRAYVLGFPLSSDGILKWIN